MRLTEKKSQNNDSQSVHVKNPLPIFGLAMIILIAVGALMFFIDINTNDLRTGKSRVDNSAEGVASRLQPIAKFALHVVEQDAPLKTGKEVYEATCTTCHAAGVAGAPIFGNKDAWAPYIKAGYEEMLNVALHGKGAMPAKGGNTALKDLEVERAMVYMANAGGADFKEPAGDDASDDTKSSEEKAAANTNGKTETAPSAPVADLKQTGTAKTDAETAAHAGGSFTATKEQLATGKKVYDSACVVCHSAGVAGAPKFGDAADWAPYIETGIDTMLEIAITGKGAMPPRGTAMNASDEDLLAAILYMVHDAQPTADATPETAKTKEAPADKASAEPATNKTEDIPAATEEQLATGKKIYDSACVACHSTGVAGAPKFGDKETWAPYIATGMDTMLQIAISGKGAMPPRGTAMNASDEDLQAAILYMIQDAR